MNLRRWLIVLMVVTVLAVTGLVDVWIASAR